MMFFLGRRARTAIGAQRQLDLRCLTKVKGSSAAASGDWVGRNPRRFCDYILHRKPASPQAERELTRYIRRDLTPQVAGLEQTATKCQLPTKLKQVFYFVDTD